MSIARPVNTPFTLADDESARGKYNMSHDSNFDIFTITPFDKGYKDFAKLDKELSDFAIEVGFDLSKINRRKTKKPEVVIETPPLQRVDHKDQEILTVLSGFKFVPVGVQLDKCQNAFEIEDKYHYNRLDVLVRYKDWTYDGKLVTEFSVPPMGNEVFTHKFENSTIVVSPLGLVGPPTASNCILGVRPKVTKVDNICFSAKLFDGEIIYFMWTMEGISEVGGTIEVGVYDIGVDGSYHLISGPRSEAPWFFFNQSWLKSHTDLEFDVNGCSYVSQVIPEIYLCVYRGHCYDYDKNGFNVLDLPRGLKDSVIVRVHYYEELHKFVYVDTVSYKRRPDTAVRVQLILKSMIKVKDLVNFIIIPVGSTRIQVSNPVQVKATDKLNAIDRTRLINEFCVPLIRNKILGTSRNAAVWEYCRTRNFYLRGDVENYLRSGLQVYIGNLGFGDTIRKRNEIVMVRTRDFSVLICGQPRLNIMWTLKYCSYENYRLYFPDFYLITGKCSYYRLFYAVVDNCLLSTLGLV